MYEDYDNADWWKRNDEPKENVIEATDIERKIAHYEKRARYHWEWWKTDGNRLSFYFYKQANIKIRKLK